MLDFSLAATDPGPLYTNVLYCGEYIIFYKLNLSVPEGFIFGTHDSMITI